eukprot:NODE_2186_length_657_cov_294.003289_g1844_i0.p2 GENE.NODE_2186_length_657_cov_294.003289_g1844_i0~~NODE_2186_length_657_cov_294.003289_g1844_i0.p2  ORF type:complete len:107 (-),score=31.99 NODE_2186_length_657_cov_294.003289_g1844_i0:336-629(-)
MGKPHETFVREGDDLIVTAEVTLADALCGWQGTVKGIDGAVHNVTMDEVITPKTRKIIPGQGMPMKRGSARGNLVVVFDIRFPGMLIDRSSLPAVLN